MKQHPLYYIGIATAVALAVVLFSKLFTQLYNQPLLWMFIIVLLVAGIATFAVSFLLFAQRLRPQARS